MHSAHLPATAISTPLADVARERTRQLMVAHMRSASVELAACTIIFAALGFAAACAI